MICDNSKLPCLIDCSNGKQKQVKSRFEDLLSLNSHIVKGTLLRYCSLLIYDMNVQDLSK